GELIERGEALGGVERRPQRGEEHRRPEAQPVGGRGGEGQELDGLEARDRAHHLLDHPRAGEAEGVRPREVTANALRGDRTGRRRPRDRDGERDAARHGESSPCPPRRAESAATNSSGRLGEITTRPRRVWRYTRSRVLVIAR